MKIHDDGVLEHGDNKVKGNVKKMLDIANKHGRTVRYAGFYEVYGDLEKIFSEIKKEFEKHSYNDLKKIASQNGINTQGMKKKDLEKILKDKGLI